MGLYFRNRTGRRLWVAFAAYSPNCGPVTWKKHGWYLVQPGDTVCVWSGYAGYGPDFYFFAENDAGTVAYAGPYGTDVPWSGFSQCWDTNTGTRRVGFRQLDVPGWAWNYTVNLV